MLDGYALRKAFHPGTPNQRVALADVTLSLAAGDFAVVIGSNGAGKSTLLNAIAGEVRVDSGRIEMTAAMSRPSRPIDVRRRSRGFFKIPPSAPRGR